MNNAIPGLRPKNDNDLVIQHGHHYITLPVIETKTQMGRMNAEQKGEYFELLLAAWQREGRLPKDADIVYQLTHTKRSQEEFYGDCELIFREFVDKGDYIENPMLRREYERLEARKASFRERGALGAKVRYGS